MERTVKNSKNLAGQLATGKERFGEFGRYAVAAVHTRFDAVEWFVWDADRIDEFGFATVIRQESTRGAAISGIKG